MKMNRLYLFAAALTLSMLACSLPVGGGEGQPEEPGETPNEIQGEPYISSPNVGNIKLLTDIEGASEKPLFAWEAVSGASRYQLIVFDEAGELYWAWEGTVTQIYMGGTDAQPPDESSGPSIEAGYSWAVTAYASDGTVIAASAVRPISP